jgi:predicted DNA-binding protein
MSGINMIRKNICFPHNILEETKKISKGININFSYLVREAIKEYIEKVRMEILKKELIEQGKDTAKLNLKICDDFKYAAGENI